MARVLASLGTTLVHPIKYAGRVPGAHIQAPPAPHLVPRVKRVHTNLTRGHHHASHVATRCTQGLEPLCVPLGQTAERVITQRIHRTLRPTVYVACVQTAVRDSIKQGCAQTVTVQTTVHVEIVQTAVRDSIKQGRAQTVTAQTTVHVAIV